MVVNCQGEDWLMRTFDRIESSADILGGKARIRGRRLTVETLVGQIACGYSVDEVLDQYPQLEREDLLQAIRYAADLAAIPAEERAAA